MGRYLHTLFLHREGKSEYYIFIKFPYNSFWFLMMYAFGSLENMKKWMCFLLRKKKNIIVIVIVYNNFHNMNMVNLFIF